ncbi:universal stress protein [Aestuariibacter sp. AA17]|uniref:Universal stress protein n=1 Tax=Fluctibacter corallii TaxID=2984329 RepID=A0ABT3A7A2_9ALTE|nr:universal stress protein [Aestuariibacter sp. AA17]MCV2884543.1 universal stress protein [Aestuariibacter sp. AA17]
MKISHVLIPLALRQDIDERHDLVLRLASREGATVTLLHVIEDLVQDPQVAIPESCADLLEWIKEEQQKRLEQIALRVKHQFQGVKIATKVLVGRAFEHIIYTASDLKTDLIVIDAQRGFHSLKNSYGSTTKHLMRKSPIPVWTLSENAKSEIPKIAVALDVNVDSEDAHQLNNQLIKCAARIAQAQETSVTLLHCWELYGESYLRNWERRDELDIAVEMEKERERRKAMCEDAVNKAKDVSVDVNIQLLHGNATDQLTLYAEKEQLDLMVMGTVCRTGIAGFLIGNTAESVLDRLSCSVLTLKPDNFKSPIL